MINRHRKTFAAVLSLCLLMAAFAVATGASAADPATGDQPATTQPDNADAGQADAGQADAGQGADAGEGSAAAETTDPPTEPPAEPTDPPVEPTDPTDPTEPTEPTGPVEPEPTTPTDATGPVADSADPQVPPAGAGSTTDPAAPATTTPEDSGDARRPAAEETVTEENDSRDGRRTAASNGAETAGAVVPPAVAPLVTDSPTVRGGIGSAPDRAARQIGDQLQRNAEAGVAASIVVTRIVSEIPTWVFWALGGLVLVALAGLALYLRELRRRRSAEHEALVDVLTGISNRKAFDRRLDLEWRRAARYGRSLGLMVMDLDGFKLVNDEKGHAEGDRVLRAVGQALDTRMRDTDLVARIGGDEFAIICPETGINELMTIRRQLSEQVGGSLDHGVGLSIGLAEYVPGDRDATSILARADESMYRVKRGDAALTTA